MTNDLLCVLCKAEDVSFSCPGCGGFYCRACEGNDTPCPRCKERKEKVKSPTTDKLLIAISHIRRLLYWDEMKGEWDPDNRSHDWSGFDELQDIDLILLDQGLIPKEGDPPPPEFPT